jgi:hypothetical protein
MNCVVMLATVVAALSVLILALWVKPIIVRVAALVVVSVIPNEYVYLKPPPTYTVAPVPVECHPDTAPFAVAETFDRT